MISRVLADTKSFLASQVLVVIALTGALAAIVYRVAMQVLHVPTIHLDGNFQTASQLFRLLSGDSFYQDFFPYLGVGPVLLIFPIFFAFQTLQASILSAHIVVLGLFVLGVALMVKLVDTRIAKIRLVSMLMLVVGVGAAVQTSMPDPRSFLYWLLSMFEFMTGPGNSLRPVRASLPIILGWGIYLLSKRPFSDRGYYWFALSLGGLSAIWSNDFGLTSLIVFWAAAISLFRSHQKGVSFVRNSLVFSGIVLGSYFLAVALVSNFNYLSWFQYNFIEVRSIQYWYFGPWEAGTRVNGVGDFLEMVWGQHLLPFFVFHVFLVVSAIRGKSAPALTISWILLAVLAGGMVATIGGHVEYPYFTPYRFWVLISATLTLVEWINRKLGKAPKFFISAGLAGFISALSAIGIAFLTTVPLIQSHLSKDPNWIFQPSLGGYVEKKMHPAHSLGNSPELSFSEEYKGLLSFDPGANYPVYSISDMVIHVTPSSRKQYLSVLDRVDSFVTTAPGPATEEWVETIWFSWNFSANYWLYRELLTNFEPEQLTPKTLLWRKNASLSPTGILGCRIENQVIKLPEGLKPGIYEIHVRYDNSKGSSRDLIMIQNNLNIPSGDGFLALNPEGEEARFPIATWQSETLETRFVEGGENFKLLGCALGAYSSPQLRESIEFLTGFENTNEIQLINPPQGRELEGATGYLYLKPTLWNFARCSEGEYIVDQLGRNFRIDECTVTGNGLEVKVDLSEVDGSGKKIFGSRVTIRDNLQNAND